MMFTGGSPEIQKLVNQAVAARGEHNGARRARGRAAGRHPAASRRDAAADLPTGQPAGPRPDPRRRCRGHDGGAAGGGSQACPGGHQRAEPRHAAQSLDAGMAPTPPPAVVTPELRPRRRRRRRGAQASRGGQFPRDALVQEG